MDSSDLVRRITDEVLRRLDGSRAPGGEPARYSARSPRRPARPRFLRPMHVGTARITSRTHIPHTIDQNVLIDKKSYTIPSLKHIIG